MSNSRLKAFEILYSILSDNAYSNIALDKALSDVDKKDKAFVSTIVYGVVERKITLDYLLDLYLTSKPKPKVKIILYIGAYQLYFMDKVPASAAINESVELSKEVGCSYYSGLVNAVLHKLDKNRINIDDIQDLSIRFSCPQELINMWLKQYGEAEMYEILNAINNRPPVFAVPNKRYVDAEELQYELLSEGIECETDGELVTLNSGFDLRKSKSFQNGLFYIEDKSSYKCALALGAKDGDTVLDVCTAPGGKAFTVAQNLKNGKVYAYDLHEHRAKLVESGAERLGLDNIVVGVNDATVFNPDILMADKVLCDVVCSGFGIIRRKPEIRYKSLDSTKELFDIQYKILSVSSRYLKDGGTLVYSTCTLNKKENEKVVSVFLESEKDFVLIKEKTVFPSDNGGDGFYYAVIQKKDQNERD